MSLFEDVWTKRGLDSLGGLSAAAQAEVASLVGRICADPYGAGAVNAVDPDPLGRARVAVAGRVMAFYEVMEDEELVRVVRVEWRR